MQSKLLLLLVLLLLPLQVLAGVTCNTDDRVIVADNTDTRLTTGSFTFAAWVKPVDFGGNGRGRIFNKRTGTTGYNFAIRDSVGSGVNTIIAAVNDSLTGSNNLVYGPDNSVTTGTWQHFAFTYTASGNVVQLYKDGSALTGSISAFAGPPSSDTTPLTLCNNNTGDDTNFFNGSIDEVFVFNEALTAAQVKQLAASKLRGLALHNAKLMALSMVNCSQGSAVNGTVFPDLSWRGNPGTADDGGNNTGMTCETVGAGLRYQRGVE